jgi:hypothetical protein
LGLFLEQSYQISFEVPILKLQQVNPYSHKIGYTEKLSKKERGDSNVERGKQATEGGGSAAQNCKQNPRISKTAILH